MIHVHARVNYVRSIAELEETIQTTGDIEHFMDALSMYVLPKTTHDRPPLHVDVVNSKIRKRGVYTVYKYPIYLEDDTIGFTWPMNQYTTTHLDDVLKMLLTGRGFDGEKVVKNPVDINLKFNHGNIFIPYPLIPNRFMPMENQLTLPDRLERLSGKEYQVIVDEHFAWGTVVTSAKETLIDLLKKVVDDEWERKTEHV